MNITAMRISSCSSADQRQDLRLDRHVERGRRLVGDQQRRAARQRHRDHHALAHAARQLVRIAVEHRARLRNAHLLEHAQRLRARRRAHPCADGAESIRQSARRPGTPGSATSSAPGRSSRSRRRECRAASPRSTWARSTSLPRGRANCSRPSTMRPPPCSTSRMIESAVTDLPEPDSPTTATVSPRRDRRTTDFERR